MLLNKFVAELYTEVCLIYRTLCHSLGAATYHVNQSIIISSEVTYCHCLMCVGIWTMRSLASRHTP